MGWCQRRHPKRDCTPSPLWKEEAKDALSQRGYHLGPDGMAGFVLANGACPPDNPMEAKFGKTEHT
jgi:hypothetical protein